jgi:hypothetical protein
MTVDDLIQTLMRHPADDTVFIAESKFSWRPVLHIGTDRQIVAEETKEIDLGVI